MNEIIKLLEKHINSDFLDFEASLIPNVSKNSILGVKTPDLRLIAKQVSNENYSNQFLKELPHQFFEENQLHSFIVSGIKDFDECIKQLEIFLPYINNWAVCDQCSPISFKKNRDKLKKYINKWIKSNRTYTVRFGIRMLMAHYLDDFFDSIYLEEVAGLCRPHIKNADDNYYVNMMVAWYFATALSKQWDASIKILEGNLLNTWCHNKTIQKARESLRISEECKAYLQSLKRK